MVLIGFQIQLQLTRNLEKGSEVHLWRVRYCCVSVWGYLPNSPVVKFTGRVVRDLRHVARKEKQFVPDNGPPTSKIGVPVRGRIFQESVVHGERLLSLLGFEFQARTRHGGYRVAGPVKTCLAVQLVRSRCGLNGADDATHRATVFRVHDAILHLYLLHHFHWDVILTGQGAALDSPSPCH